MTPASPGPGDPLWYKDAIFYQLHVRAFCDSTGDGIGDFRGLASKLDYLQDLGVNTLWLLPFYPSPLRDDGYDIADYTAVHPMYGTMEDFRLLLDEAHRRGLRVVTELVLNHTSDQHAWFQRARRAPQGSSHRDFYVWSDTPEKFREARIIFKDFETSNWTWDPVAKSYFWHRFYSHQPDLNFDNPEVRKALVEVLDFWFRLGVDGMRLDAVPYLYEREGTSCENLPETHAFLQELRKHVDEKFPNRMLLAEANQWPEDAVAYLGQGDECHMAFHFPIMPRMFMAVHMEDRYPLIDILNQTPAIPESCQWALFLRNHDELTLEMVTDEERDYMYRVYAHDRQARINLGIRRRLAPLLGNNRRKIELLNSLLFSLPGTPVIYYGDEIGMGDNIYLGDRNGVRTPMQWTSERNAGFSRCNPQKIYLPVTIDPEYHYEAVNVEAQQQNPHSLLWWMKRLMALSRRYKAFGRGSMELLTPENRKVFTFLRRLGDEVILVVANLSRFVQYVELDLAGFKGRVPVELFGRAEFPPIGERPYLLSLGPHAFFWFALEPARQALPAGGAPQEPLRALEVGGPWTEVLRAPSKSRLEAALAAYVPTCRWYESKALRLKSIKVLDSMPLPLSDPEVYWLRLKAEFTDGAAQVYSLPLAFATAERAEQVRAALPHAVIVGLRCREKDGTVDGLLYDAAYDAAFTYGLLESILQNAGFSSSSGCRLEAVSLPSLARLTEGGDGVHALAPLPVKGEQSNTSVIYGDRLILKLVRRLEEGVNPDLEVGRFLTEKAGFAHSPPVAGYLEMRSPDEEVVTLGILNAYLPNEGNAWSYTVDALGRYFESVRLRTSPLSEDLIPRLPLVDLIELTPPTAVQEMMGSYLETARILGHRTAELHLALASDPEDPNFAPEPFTPFYQRSIYQSMRGQANLVLPLLRKRLSILPDPLRPEADQVLASEKAILKVFQSVNGRRLSAFRIRCHGDYHLGQLLHTGKDFVILDFEGEPSRPVSERRIKRSPLRDIAGMLRSFHYAVYSALSDLESREDLTVDRLPILESAAQLWYSWAGSAFLRAYLQRTGTSAFVPPVADLALLLRAYLLDRCVFELEYELIHRPSWVRIPLKGILQLLAAAEAPPPPLLPPPGPSIREIGGL